jgi:hypothetical protein
MHGELADLAGHLGSPQPSGKRCEALTIRLSQGSQRAPWQSIPLLVTGYSLVNLELPATLGSVTALAKNVTAAYGQYVSDYMGCAICHGANMDGQVKPPQPRRTSLRAVMSYWSRDQFFTAMRPASARTAPPWKS